MDSQSSQTLEYQSCNGQGDAGRRPAPNYSHSILAGRWGCSGAGTVTDTNNDAEPSGKLIGLGRLDIYDNKIIEKCPNIF
jgi:hypothetical protein